MINIFNFPNRCLTVEQKTDTKYYILYDGYAGLSVGVYDLKKGRYISNRIFYTFIDYERFIYNLCKKIEKNKWDLKYNGLYRKIYVKGRFHEIPAPDLCFNLPD